MSNLRPAPVGVYELLQDFECEGASVRILRLSGTASSVEPHLHHRSLQIYVAIEGTSLIDTDGVETAMSPYDVLEVPRGRLHSARPASGSSILVNISIPPLAADDQVPRGASRP